MAPPTSWLKGTDWDPGVNSMQGLAMAGPFLSCLNSNTSIVKLFSFVCAAITKHRRLGNQ